MLAYPEDSFEYETSTHVCKLKRHDGNLIGLSIAGGAPTGPCIYVVSTDEKICSDRDETLISAGDEITHVNNYNVKGYSRQLIADLVRKSSPDVTLTYKRIKVDMNKERTMDIVSKKIKHRVVEKIKPTAADFLGLTRAILCNDTLVRKLDYIERLSRFSRHFFKQMCRLCEHYMNLNDIRSEIGTVFKNIGAREPQEKASAAFTKIGELHQLLVNVHKSAYPMLQKMLEDISTFHVVLKDMKQTVAKYADSKYEYLSYCLKARELEEEEEILYSFGESIYRVETGNYQYRAVLRCRQLSKVRFMQMKKTVVEKLDLLDKKNIEHLSKVIRTFAKTMVASNNQCMQYLPTVNVLPIEVDLFFDTIHSIHLDGDDTNAESDIRRHTRNEECPLIELDASDGTFGANEGGSRQLDGPTEGSRSDDTRDMLMFDDVDDNSAFSNSLFKPNSDRKAVTMSSVMEELSTLYLDPK